MESFNTFNGRLIMSINNLTVTEIQHQMSMGLLTSENLVIEALNRIDQNNDRHAFITIDREGALAQAKHYDQLRANGDTIGPLHGIIVAVKDNIHVAGLPNTAGTLALKDFIPDKDATVIRRLKEAGAIIIGKTNMHELAYGITSDNKTFGSVGNAISGTFIAGGSSGGTATAVALNMATIGLGTDTGGSVRIPASLNGLVGFRPSINRYPSEGLTGISHTRDTVGPIVSSIEDAQLLDGILSGETDKHEEVTLSNLRIGVPREYFYDNLEPSIAEKTDILLDQLKQAGVELINADLEDIGELNEKIGFPVVLYETKELLSAYIDSNIPSETLLSLSLQISDPGVKDAIDMVLKGSITKEIYEDVINRIRPQLQQLYCSYFSQQNVDAIIFPTTPLSARPIIGSEKTVELNGTQVPTFPTYMRNTEPSSNAGIPGLSIPLSVTDNGLPFGIEIDGPVGSDQRLLAIGLEIEKLINSNTVG
ncbi:MAG: indoleacetamide hydrolase [Colwellia sp.]|nr:indoleacetamide hydrolase [Colwellia sp.]